MRTRTPWLIVGLAFVFAVGAVWLTVENGNLLADAGFVFFAIAIVAGWSVVGAMLASKNPGNPIGWLMIAFAFGFIISGFGDEWKTYALVTEPGALPLATFWAWLVNWSFLAGLPPIPIVLLLYPTGSVPSPRWRLLPWAIVATATLAAVATILRSVPIDGTPDVPNPTGVPSLDGAASLALTVAGVGFVVVLIPLCIVSVIVRFRRSRGIERQQIRWLAYVVAIAGVAFATAVISGIGLGPTETNLVNEVSFYTFFLTVGFGVPAAIGIALLRYRLWDLDVVLKKTLVAAVVVILITVLVLALLLATSAVITDLSTDETLAVGLVMFAIGVLVWPLLRLSRRVADRLVYGGRATPYEVLTGFSERMADSYSTEDVLPRMASILGAGTGAEAVTIWLYVDDGFRPAATWPVESHGVELAPSANLGDAEAGTFEVRHQGELLGAITARMPANDPMNPSKERLIRDLAQQAGLVLRNVRLIEELRSSRRRIVAAVDEGRRRLERNIHDGAQQQLVALAVKIRLAETLLDRDPAKARGYLAELQAETNDALENLRDLARGIYPPLLADEGLAAALEAQARRSPVPVRVSPNGIGRYPQEVEATVYFCVLEALTNTAKYASASSVEVELRVSGGELAFEVRDDGQGFDPATAPRGTGLQGMADRVEAVGGTLEVRSAPGTGTRVAGRVPVGTDGRP